MPERLSAVLADRHAMEHEIEPQISPDGRLLAYASNESGQVEAYVRPLPGAGPRVSDVTPAGDFVMLEPASDAGPQLFGIANWFEELKRRTDGDGAGR